MGVIRVLICDDQAVVREGLEMILNADGAIRVVGMAADGLEALELIPKCEPDLILMDLKMPGMNGIQATREATTRHPGIPVLILTTFADDDWVFDAIRSGAAGYLLKGTPRQELVAAIKGTVQGNSHIDPAVARKVMRRAAEGTPESSSSVFSELTVRETEVLKLLAQGLSNSEIAKNLHLTPGTVRNYVSAILRKLDVKDRTQAAILSIQYGLNR
ncbi:MAG: response regulator transcription factor [Anaerolineae bacterium]|nr:MAG: response regulator transcription factor [Anaerolineae bacterium]